MRCLGEFIQGKSSEELGAKYVAPDVSLYRAEKPSISVGRLDVESPKVAEIDRSNETQVGKLIIDDHRTTGEDIETGNDLNSPVLMKDIESGQATEEGGGMDEGGEAHQIEAPSDSNSSSSDIEEVPIEVELEGGEAGESAIEELSRVTVPNKNNTLRRKPTLTTLLIMILLVIIAVLSTLLSLQRYEEVEINAINAATAVGGSESGQDDITGTEAATQSVSPTATLSFAPSTLPSRSSGEPSVTFSDVPFQSRIQPDDTSRPSVASSTQPSTKPTVASSRQPSTQPWNEPVPTCSEGTRLFSIQYPTSVSTTIGTTKTKWAFKDPCTGEVVSECLPCSSRGNGGGLFGGSGLSDMLLGEDDGKFSSDVSPFERNRRIQEETITGTFQCLPEGDHYVFEISLADSEDECCGFDGSTAIISYDGGELSFEAVGAFSTESHFGQEESCSTPRPTDTPSVSQEKPSPSPSCPPHYKPRVTYEGGDLVVNPKDASAEIAIIYSCRAFPFTDWCAQQAYEPGVALDFDLAWETLGSCELQPAALSAQPSLSLASPSGQPSFTPTQRPTRRPSQVPSSSEPSSSPQETVSMEKRIVFAKSSIHQPR